MARPRWILHLQAQFWRTLMGIGMYLHRLAPPHPPRPKFTKTIPAKLSGRSGQINLYFYVPLGYDTQNQLWKGKPIERQETDVSEGDRSQRRKSVIDQVGETIRRRQSLARKWGGYPVVINFHGGGFTLGTPTDDARWCGTVVDECNAVVVSVDYRLAPEHPFPTAVEDGVDAVIWVHEHAKELGIDPDKIALSGFSSGGNMAFTVPLRLWDEMTGFVREGGPNSDSASHIDNTASSTSSSSNLPGGSSKARTTDPTAAASATTPQKTGAQVTTEALRTISDISLRAVIPWYPSLDYTRTREQRRATNVRKDQELPAIFTDLFDESYLHPPNNISLDSPYLSPGVAPTQLLKHGLPQEIIMHTCEWDMLLDEGQAFHERLISSELDKTVFYKMIEGVPHGWDKAPNPLKPTPGVREHYLRACKELRRIFGSSGLPERKTNEGPSAAPRGSVSLVR